MSPRPTDSLNRFTTLPNSSLGLGGICQNGHDHEGTGKSLRYKLKSGKLANCVVCSREAKREQAEKKRLAKAALAPPKGYKKCPMCEQVLALDSFPSTKKGTARGAYCKPCHNKKTKQHYANSDNAKSKAKSKQNRQRDWMGTILRNSKSSSRKRGLTNTLTIEVLQTQFEKQEGLCYWLGLPLGDGFLPNRHPLKPSLDRIDPLKGYEPDNVVFACCFANLGRSNTGPEDFAEFIAVLKAHHRK